MHCKIIFPANKWINVDILDSVLEESGCPHDSKFTEITFRFSSNCKVMIDAGVRILALANQLASTGRPEELLFDDGEEGTMGYLNRMGFFDLLPGQDDQDSCRTAVFYERPG